MMTKSITRIFVFSIMSISLFSCKTEEILLWGHIKGLITNPETSEPIRAATVRLKQTNDTANTGNYGTYYLKNITPGDYEIQAFKYGYDTLKENIEVASAKTTICNFIINKIPLNDFSVTYLDFGLDLTTLSFTISNTASMNYLVVASQDWITVSPTAGQIVNGTDTLTVRIDRTGLLQDTIKETITIISYIGNYELPKTTIDIYFNGVFDIRSNKNYKAVKIGGQIWMAENLNVGIQITDDFNQTDNDTVEKYCYYNAKINCNIFGGLYQWDELMQYNSSDTGTVGTTQGICPAGYHMPTEKEWRTLLNCLGDNAGGKLKETGTEHWWPSLSVTTNESGFTARAGGNLAQHKGEPRRFDHLFERGLWMCATEFSENQLYYLYIYYDDPGAFLLISDETETNIKSFGNSVRCLKDK